MKQVACVIMASGLGKRFGGNKLLAEFHGKTLIQHILDKTNGCFAVRIVVTRSEEVARLCREQQVPVIFHQLPDRSDTVRIGLEAVKEWDACLFCPCDQPMLQQSSILQLIQAFQRGEKGIARLCCGEQVGAPVLFDRKYFADLLNLPLHNGGSYVIKQHPDDVQLCPAASAWELFDVDRQEDLLELKKQFPNEETDKA